MKAEKAVSANNAGNVDKTENGPEEPLTVSTALTAPRDSATLRREILGISAEEYERICTNTRETKRLKKVKPIPDSRYTEQAILDREILGLKKLCS